MPIEPYLNRVNMSPFCWKRQKANTHNIRWSRTSVVWLWRVSGKDRQCQFSDPLCHGLLYTSAINLRRLHVCVVIDEFIRHKRQVRADAGSVHRMAARRMRSCASCMRGSIYNVQADTFMCSFEYLARP